MYCQMNHAPSGPTARRKPIFVATIKKAPTSRAKRKALKASFFKDKKSFLSCYAGISFACSKVSVAQSWQKKQTSSGPIAMTILHPTRSFSHMQHVQSGSMLISIVPCLLLDHDDSGSGIVDDAKQFPDGPICAIVHLE